MIVPRDPAAPVGTGPLPSTAAVAVSPHHLVSRAALDILADGGNAVDAAVAANAVLGVVLPDTCGVGGDLFALVHRPGRSRPAAVNASGRAGSRADAAALRRRGFHRVPDRSPSSITVPGCVDGWELLLAEYGTLPLDRVLASAVTVAEEGFPVSVELADSLRRLRPAIGGQAAAVELYPDGETPAPGTSLRRPLLARTLAELAAGGRGAFYLGPVGDGIVTATEGTVTPEDLRHRQADTVDPIGNRIFGLDAWTIPPNTQGYLTLATLWLFEQLDPPRDPADPAYHHALLEAFRAVAWERDDLVADPNHAPLPPEELLDPDRLAPRLAAIGPTAGTWPTPEPRPGGTAYLCVRDGDGLGVSLIQSNYHGIGTGISAGATGVWLHDRGAGFTLEPGHPNELAPGKRPLHTLSPSLWTRDGRLHMLLGTRGGHYQPQLLAQVAAHHLWAGRDLDDAQAHPRWVLDEFGPGAPSVVQVEGRFSEATAAGLAERGHRLEASPSPWMAGWGPVAVIVDDAGAVRGAADPRVSTSAALFS